MCHLPPKRYAVKNGLQLIKLIFEVNRFSVRNVNTKSGIDKVTYKEYGENLRQNIQELIRRLKDKKYKAADIRRAWIPKPDGGKRPLGIAI